MAKKKKTKFTDNLWRISAVVMLFVFGLAIFGVFKPLSESISGMFAAVTPTDTQTDGNVVLTIITDEECKELCDYSGTLGFFQNYAKNLEVKMISYQSEEGRNIIKETGVGLVPAFFLSKNLDDSSFTESGIYEGIQNLLFDVGDYYFASKTSVVQRSVDPDAPDVEVKLVKEDEDILSYAEISALSVIYGFVENAKLSQVTADSSEGSSILNTYSITSPAFILPENSLDTETVLGINSLLSQITSPIENCKKTIYSSGFKTEAGFDVLSIIEELVDAYPKTDEPKLEFFVMSFCYYGNQAEDVLKPVYDLLGDYALIEPHYIVSPNPSSPDGYSSLQEEQELHQDVRELCVWKYYDQDTWWDFVFDINSNCGSNNVDTCWEQYATSNGIDINMISTCEEDEASDLLDADIALTTSYGVTGSPTLIINGERYVGSRTPDAIKEALCCAFNDEPAECSVVI